MKIGIEINDINDLSKTLVEVNKEPKIGIDEYIRNYNIDADSYCNVIRGILDKVDENEEGRVDVIIHTCDGIIEAREVSGVQGGIRIVTPFKCIKHLQVVIKTLGNIGTIEIRPNRFKQEIGEDIILDGVDTDSFYHQHVTINVCEGINGVLNINKLLESKYLDTISICRWQKKSIIGNTDKVKGKEVIIETLVVEEADIFEYEDEEEEYGIIDISNRYVGVSTTNAMMDELTNVEYIMHNCIFKDTMALINTIFMTPAKRFDLRGAMIEDEKEISINADIDDIKTGHYEKVIRADGEIYETLKKYVEDIQELNEKELRMIESRRKRLNTSMPYNCKRILIKE